MIPVAWFGGSVAGGCAVAGLGSAVACCFPHGVSFPFYASGGCGAAL